MSNFGLDLDEEEFIVSNQNNYEVAKPSNNSSSSSNKRKDIQVIELNNEDREVRRQLIEIFNNEHREKCWVYREYYVDNNQFNTGDERSESACSAISVYICATFVDKGINNLPALFRAITDSLKGGTALWTIWKKMTTYSGNHANAPEICNLELFKKGFPNVVYEENVGNLYPDDNRMMNNRSGSEICNELEELCYKIISSNQRTAYVFTSKSISVSIFYIPNRRKYIWIYDSHGSKFSKTRGSFYEFPNYLHMIEHLRSRFEVSSLINNEGTIKEIYSNQFTMTQIKKKL